MTSEEKRIRFVTPGDKTFWYSLDQHLPEQEFDKKVRDQQGYVLLVGEKPVGLLRYNLFWDNTPFCTLLYIDENHRKQGCGAALMEHWEQDMRRRNAACTTKRKTLFPCRMIRRMWSKT